MTVPVIAFFSTKGGVGKSFLAYHTAWMLSDLGYRVVAADLDPQSNLSAACLDEARMEQLSQRGVVDVSTIYGAVVPLRSETGDVSEPWLETVTTNFSLIPGDISLFGFENDLSDAWFQSRRGESRAFLLLSAFWRVLQRGATRYGADVVLMDLAPNLGAINRAALIAADFVVIPIGPDLFSIQGLHNLGNGLRELRQVWGECRIHNPIANLILPEGRMAPIGYVVMQQQSGFQNRQTRPYQNWMARIPAAYRQTVLDESQATEICLKDDENCLAVLKYYRSLLPMAQEAGKPVFALKPADGALGATLAAVRDAYHDIKQLSLKIAERAGLQRRP